jgi:hypothetical protein
MSTRFPRRLSFLAIAFAFCASALTAQQPSIETRLRGFHDYMAQVLKDWNVPGIIIYEPSP